MSNAYQLKPWTSVVTPHQDILEGKLDSSIYAASLGAVVRGDSTCPKVYRDAREFFAATYFTKELRKLLEDVLRGLRGEPGIAFYNYVLPLVAVRLMLLLAFTTLPSTTNSCRTSRN